MYRRPGLRGARFLPAAQEAFALELADYWDARLDEWTTVRGSALYQRRNLRGHYVRTTPAEALKDDAVLARVAPIKNWEQDPGLSAAEQIGGDFLQLVRYGLRDPDEPLIRDTGMLPEQVWDAADIPEHNLRRGGPTGSARPLAWAHAKYIKLACSILEGRPVDRPEPLWARYHKRPATAHVWYWSSQAPIRRLPAGTRLAVCLADPAHLAWELDADTHGETATRDTGLGVHVAHLPAFPAAGRHIDLHLPGDSPTYTFRVYILSG